MESLKIVWNLNNLYGIQRIHMESYNLCWFVYCLYWIVRLYYGFRWMCMESQEFIWSPNNLKSNQEVDSIIKLKKIRFCQVLDKQIYKIISCSFWRIRGRKELKILGRVSLLLGRIEKFRKLTNLRDEEKITI